MNNEGTRVQAVVVAIMGKVTDNARKAMNQIIRKTRPVFVADRAHLLSLFKG